MCNLLSLNKRVKNDKPGDFPLGFLHGGTQPFTRRLITNPGYPPANFIHINEILGYPRGGYTGAR